MRKAFLLVLAILFSSAISASAENVTFKLVNKQGVTLSGTIGFQFQNYGQNTAPRTMDIALPADIHVRAVYSNLVFEGTFQAPDRQISIASGQVIRYDMGVGQLIDSTPSGEGSTEVLLVLDAAVVTIDAVDASGDHIPGSQITFNTFNATVPAPHTPTGFIRAGVSTWLSASAPGFATTATKSVVFQSASVQTINALDVNHVTTIGSSDARVHFQFGVGGFEVPIQTVDINGTPIVGEIKIGGGAFQPSPVTLVNQLPGMQVAVQGRTLGLTSQTAVITVHPDSTFAVATDASVTSSYTPNDPKVNVVFDQVPVTVRTVNSAGQAVDGEVQLSGGVYQGSPVTQGVLNGNSLSVRAKFNGFEMLSSVGVTIQRGNTYQIDAITRQVATTPTPGKTEVYVVFPSVEVEIAVTDLDGDPIVDLNGTSLRGQVFVNNVTPDWVLSSHSMLATQGQNLGVRGRFDDLTTASKTVQVLKDHTVVISANDGVQNDPVSTPGETRVEFRFDPLEFNASVIGSAGIDLENATVRLVNITDLEDGTPHAVSVPHKVLIRGGRLINVEVYYNDVEAYQFNMQTQGGEIRVYDQDGQFTGTEPTANNKTGFEAQIDDAPVAIQTVNSANQPVAGEIQVSGGTYENAPVTLGALNGQPLSIRAKFNGFEMISSVGVVIARDYTHEIDVITRQVATTPTPGKTEVYVVFPSVEVEIAVTDLDGDPIVDLDGTSLRGHVFVNEVTSDWVLSSHSMLATQGQNLSMRGRFDDLETATKVVQVLKDHTVVISANDGVQNDPVSTPGETRVEFRYDPLEFNASVIGAAGIDLENATVRLVGITDQNGTPHAVSVPHKVLIRGGRLINVEVYYNDVEAYQFNMQTQGGVIRVYDQDGEFTGTEPTANNKTGFEAQIDDAPVTIQTVDGLGEPVNGQIRIGSGVYQTSPASLELQNGQVLAIQGKYNNFEMFSSVSVAVHRDSTKSINALTRQVTSVYTPDVTAIHVVFGTALVEVAITDVTGNPIVDSDGQVYGQVQINGVTTTWEPSGFEHYANAGQTLGIKGRFDNLESGFHAVPVLANHLVTINPVTGVVSDPVQVDLAGKMRIEFRYDPVVFTAQVVNEHGENLDAATLRLVGITDPQADTPGFVATPFTALLQNGRNLNMQVQYGLHQPTSFGLPKVVGGSVLVYNKDGGQTGSQPVPGGTGGARIVIDDASVTVKTVFAEAEVTGNLNVKLYTNLFQPSPIQIPHIVNGSVLEIAANYNGVNMNAVLAPVVENNTVMINGLTGEVGQPVATPGETLILVNFNPNRPPVADAGPEQAVLCLSETAYVTLNGSATTDPDGDSVTLTWTGEFLNRLSPYGPLTEPVTGVSPEIRLVKRQTPHVVTLTVMDPDGAMSTDQVQIQVGDYVAPEVTVSSPDAGHYVKSTVRLTGAISEPFPGSRITALKVNGNNKAFTGEAPNYAFDVTASLPQEGENTVVVEAIDVSGNVGQATILLLKDSTPPEIVITAPTGMPTVTDASVTVTGTVSDAGSGIASVTVNGTPVAVEEGAFSAQVTFEDGPRTVKVRASDNAGNVVEATSELVVDALPPAIAVLTPSTGSVVEALTVTVSATAQDVGTSVASVVFQGGVEDVTATLTDGVYAGAVTLSAPGPVTLTVVAADASGNVATKPVTLTVNTGGPPIASLRLIDSASQPIAGQRVDLLRSNGSNTGVRQNTDGEGMVSFEVDPGAVHKLRVYHNGGSFDTDAITLGVVYEVKTIRSSLVLTNSGSQPIADQRVDLLRSNGSNTGVRTSTGGDGIAAFEVLPGYAHKFLVYHNGGSFDSSPALSAAVGGDPITVPVQTRVSKIKLTDSGGGAIAEQRVDLLRSNGSNTGVRTQTNAAGDAVFEILPGYAHAFLIYYNGGSLNTEVVSEIAPEGVAVQTRESTLTLARTPSNATIEGARVDLLRENGSNTGVLAYTNGGGIASFQVLPGFAHKFQVYHNGGSYVTDAMVP